MSSNSPAERDIANVGDSDRRSILFSVERFVGDVRVPVGGFADRIKGLSFAYLCAVATGRRFYVEWPTPTPLLDTYRPGQVDWVPPPALLEPSDEEVRCDWVENGFTNEVVSAIESGRLEDGLFAGAERVKLWMNFFRPDHFRNSPYADRIRQDGLSLDDDAKLMRGVFERLFRFAPTGEVASRFDTFKAFRDNHPNVVAVQFRTGGDGKWHDPAMDNHSNALEAAAAALALASTMAPGAGFYVTTDSERAREVMVERLAGNGDVFTFDVAPVHVDRAQEDEAARALVNFVSAEFEALRQCDAIVIGNGGFGQTAGYTAGRSPIHYNQVARG